MSTRSQSDIEEEAGRWVVRMHSDQVTSKDERMFAAWLAEDEANGAAYDRQNKLWSSVGALRHDSSAMEALSDLREATPQPERPTRRGLLAASIAGGAIAAAGGSWLGYRVLFGTQAYATEIGEQRRIVLDDGSAVTLNTNSALRLRFTDNERRLWLDHGQAFFAVAHDAGRPFRVFVGEDEVRAVGTAFDIRREGSRAMVTVEDGAVAVYRATVTERLRAEPAVVVEASQQLVVAPAQEMRIAVVDTRRTGAWRFGQIVLDADPLSTAVAEINRYNARQIVIADPSLNGIAINGVFQTGRPEAFVETLTAAFPVSIQREDEFAIYLHRRDSL